MKAYKKNIQSFTERDTITKALYNRELSRCRVIPADEERALFPIIRKGGKEGKIALDKVVKSHLLFVMSLANKCKNCGLMTEDLIAEGNLGLLNAVEKYEPFYPNFRIRWLILTYILS